MSGVFSILVLGPDSSSAMGGDGILSTKAGSVFWPTRLSGSSDEWFGKIRTTLRNTSKGVGIPLSSLQEGQETSRLSHGSGRCLEGWKEMNGETVGRVTELKQFLKNLVARIAV